MTRALVQHPDTRVSSLPRLQYERAGDEVVRTISSGRRCFKHRIKSVAPKSSPETDWHLSRARGNQPSGDKPSGTLKIVDLFCGSGGLGLGTHWAAEALGLRAKTLLAADIDERALDVHTYNLWPARTFNGSVRELLKHELLTGAADPSSVDPAAVRLDAWPTQITRADIVIGGPPCQGHSNLNNRSRRKDSRNELYLWMAVAAHATTAKAVIIENVPTVRADAGDVVERTIALLERMGYLIAFDGILSADAFGVPQSRRRHFLIAVRHDARAGDQEVEGAARWLRERSITPITVGEAIEDLQDLDPEDDYDTPSRLSPENTARVEWLHAEGEFDLPDEHRPACHRDKDHSYMSVYGRMDPEQPAPTLSTGFLSPGRGRYVHPTRPRTLTPHEGARVQGFPDDFRFVGDSGAVIKRTRIARMIGDAVPPPLAMHVALAALSMLKSD